VPELPEVETIARQLAPLVTGRVIKGIRVLDPKLRAVSRSRLAGDRIIRVFRTGKQLAIELSGPRWLVIHLRMTGRLTWQQAPVARRHLRLRLRLEGGNLCLHDARRFGTVQVVDELVEPGGLDPTSRRFTLAALEALIGSGRQPVKPWLLRQDRLVGLGNIYASEILFEAGIDPRRAVGSLAPAELRRLHRCTRAVLRRAIRACGTTFSDFQDARGGTGSYQRYLRVYGREEQACPGCGGAISRLEQQQRSTFFCPVCQR
jgi:formamidopyrimidine-DNA glycosylase